MPKPENVIENGFKANPQNINKEGRPKKIYTILKEKGFNADDIKAAFGEIAWYDIKELDEIHTDKSKPVIVRILANQFKKALEAGDWTKIKEILEHTIGRPTQTLNANIGTSKKDLKNIFPTDEELEETEDK